MNDYPEDLMWPHFAPLWEDLRKAGGENLLLAGGYGLFLKQKWLLANPGIPVIVPVQQWRDTSPRVTKDLDFVLGLELIAREETQKALRDALQKNLYTVIPKNKWWQFEKRLSETHSVTVDLHAPLPPKDHPHLRANNRRVKHKPSLRSAGIHALINPEAVGYDLHPYQFMLDGVQISVPNPVTWSLMKMAAMRDRWEQSQTADKPGEDRLNARDQATKHAQDVCRVVAMVTRKERDQASNVVDVIQTTQVFAHARQTFSEFFETEQGWGTRNVSLMWTSDNFMLIQETLASWFR